MRKMLLSARGLKKKLRTKNLLSGPETITEFETILNQIADEITENAKELLDYENRKTLDKKRLEIAFEGYKEQNAIKPIKELADILRLRIDDEVNRLEHHNRHQSTENMRFLLRKTKEQA